MSDRPAGSSSRLVLAAARRVLAGTGGACAVDIVALAAQRVAFPIAALRIAASDLAGAGAALGVTVVLGLARAIVGDWLSARVRRNVLDAFLGAATVLPPHEAESAETISPRFAVAMPELARWSRDGVVASAGGALAMPFVLTILLNEFKVSLVAPLAAVGFALAMGAVLASRRLAALWQRAWERLRVVHERFHNLHQGLLELRAQAELGRFAEGVRADLTRFSREDTRARRIQALAVFTVSLVALAAGIVAAVVLAARTTPLEMAWLPRSTLVALAAVPALSSVVSGLGRLTAVRSELETVGALPLPPSPVDVGPALDARAELRFEGVSFRYPTTKDRPERPVLEGLDFVLPRDGSVAVVGPNGAGKTTFLHLLVGILAPDAGVVRLGGQAQRLDDQRWHERLAYVSQRPLEMPDRSVADNVRAFAPDASDAEIAEALREVGVWPAIRRRVDSDAAVLTLAFGALSRGEARRVALGRAFVRPADLVVLDEPEANLDQEARASLVETLRRLALRSRVVAAVHDPEVAAFASIVLDLGGPGA